MKSFFLLFRTARTLPAESFEPGFEKTVKKQVLNAKLFHKTDIIPLSYDHFQLSVRKIHFLLKQPKERRTVYGG